MIFGVEEIRRVAKSRAVGLGDAPRKAAERASPNLQFFPVMHIAELETTTTPLTPYVRPLVWAVRGDGLVYGNVECLSKSTSWRSNYSHRRTAPHKWH